MLVVHGSGFGEKPGTRHMRIVFLPPEPVLSEAYDAMTDFMKERYSRGSSQASTEAVSHQDGIDSDARAEAVLVNARLKLSNLISDFTMVDIHYPHPARHR